VAQRFVEYGCHRHRAPDAISRHAAAASGGLKSINADHRSRSSPYGTPNIGDIAVFQKDPNIVWVGTGVAQQLAG
jgi:hypothetical protein